MHVMYIHVHRVIGIEQKILFIMVEIGLLMKSKHQGSEDEVTINKQATQTNKQTN